MKCKEKTQLGTIFGLSANEVEEADQEGVRIVHRNDINTSYKLLGHLEVKVEHEGRQVWRTYFRYAEEDTREFNQYSRDPDMFHNFKVVEATPANVVHAMDAAIVNALAGIIPKGTIIPDGIYSSMRDGSHAYNFELYQEDGKTQMHVINGLWDGEFCHKTQRIYNGESWCRVGDIVTKKHSLYWSY